MSSVIDRPFSEPDDNLDSARGRTGGLAGITCVGLALHSYTGQGPAQTFVEIANGMQSAGINVRAFLPRLRISPAAGAAFQPTIPLALRALPWKWVRDIGKRSAEHALLSALKGKDPAQTVVFAFPDMSLETARAIRAGGYALVREMTNLHRGTARRIISAEHEIEGLPPFTDISPASVDEEIASLKLATHVIAPNPHVRASLIEHGVRDGDIYDASYGWSRDRFPIRKITEKRASGERVAIFVGRVSYQKGAHLLLRAWHEAGCPGRLMLAGNIEGDLQARLSHLLDHPSIEKLGFVQDVAAEYLAADYFIFPSLVEGGPQVTYEAAAHGLPLIVSPMGAGRLRESDGAGQIVDPHDIEQMAAAITDYAVRDNLSEIGARAAQWAQAFEWGAIGAERANVIGLAAEERRLSI
ncbi:MAG TPA: glycosyltransferase family 4 protein [Novosphingobium sp.]